MQTVATDVCMYTILLNDIASQSLKYTTELENVATRCFGIIGGFPFLRR